MQNPCARLAKKVQKSKKNKIKLKKKHVNLTQDLPVDLGTF